MKSKLIIGAVIGAVLSWGFTAGAVPTKAPRLVKGTVEVTDTLLSEDFSKFTQGSEASPTSADLASSGTIASKYTKTAGWTGESVYQAGGVADIGMDAFGWFPGKIATPAFDASKGSATFTVTFRARSSQKSDKLIVNRKSGGNQNIDLTNEWKSFTVNYTTGTNAEQITFAPSNSECLIDDIAIITTRTEEADVAPVGAVLYENFNKFIAGTENAPKKGDLKGLVNIPDTLTIVPGWKGEGIYQAGGSAYVGAYGNDNAQGYIKTPVVNLANNAGTFTLQFRSKFYGGGITAQSSVIGALYDVTGAQPVLVETQYADITTDWGEYTLTFNRGTAKCYMQLYFYAGEGWLDDVALVQPVSELTAPVALDYTKLTDTGFTANWQAVDGADSYLLSVYERGNGTRTYVFEDKAVSGLTYDVTGIDTSKPYYYNVKAVKGDKKSVQSNQIEVLGLAEPELLQASNVTASSFDANWRPVNRATTYELTTYVKHTAAQDESYDIINEDFDGFKSGTIANPAACSVLEWNINDKISRADWVVRNRIDAAGTVGLDNSFQNEYGTSWLHSPVLDLSNADGKVNVSVKVYGKDVKQYTVSLCDSEGNVISSYDGSATADWSTASFTLTGGTKASYISFDIPASQAGQLFIDKLQVSQKLAAGNTITVPYYGKEISNKKSAEVQTATVSVPNWTDADVYSYTVRARRIFSSQYITARYIYSHRPTPVVVEKLPSTGVDGISVEAATECEHYNAAGQRIAADAPGLHIVRMSDGTSKKVLVK